MSARHASGGRGHADDGSGPHASGGHPSGGRGHAGGGWGPIRYAAARQVELRHRRQVPGGAPARPHRRLHLSLLLAGFLVLACSAGTLAAGGRRIVAEEAAFSGPAAPHCVPATLNRSAVLPGTSLAVSPLPDSLDASPRTQISLLGVPASKLSDVKVGGSVTGGHSGRLLAYSQGDGASFVPAQPFESGETVTVRGRLSTGAGSEPFAFHFNVSRPDPLKYYPPGKEPAGKTGEVQHFVSQPSLQPPAITVSTHTAQESPGDIFTAPYSGPGQDGPMIFNSAGQLVWFHPVPHGIQATDFEVQQYEGKPVLTWWQGYIPPQGFGQGEVIIDNAAYQQIAPVDAGNGYKADLHEFRIDAANGTALLTVLNPIHCNLTAVSGPRTARSPTASTRKSTSAPGSSGANGPRSTTSASRIVFLARRQQHGMALRLLPHELDRPPAQRPGTDLGPEHLGAVRAQRLHRPGDRARRRPPQHDQDGQRHPHRLPARRRGAGERHDQRLRQRRRRRWSTSSRAASWSR